MANMLNKSQRKSAYMYVRTRILRGKNVDEYGKLGICNMLHDWLVLKGPDFSYPNGSDASRWFPEFKEEEPVLKMDNGPDEGLWFPADDDASRIELLTKCINKL
jgi:hypothetical protein